MENIFISSTLGKSIYIHTYLFGSKINHLILLLEPYGFHYNKPFGPKVMQYFSHLNNTLIIEPDASLGILIDIQSQYDDFKDLKKGSWYIDSEYTGNYLSAFAEITKTYLERFEIKERAFVIGASMGGWGSILLSTLHPELFQLAISVDGPSFFGKSFLNVEQNADILTEITGVDKQTTIAYFKDMVETLDLIFTNGQLMKTMKVEGNRVTVDNNLFSKWEKWFPINVIEKKPKDVEYAIIVNYFDTTTMISDEKLHQKMLNLNIPHNYIVFLGKKKASHFTGIVDGFKYSLKILEEKLS